MFEKLQTGKYSHSHPQIRFRIFTTKRTSNSIYFHQLTCFQFIIVSSFFSTCGSSPKILEFNRLHLKMCEELINLAGRVFLIKVCTEEY